jgi:hypothetical protein
MKEPELKLKVEELEERIAPSIFATDSILQGVVSADASVFSFSSAVHVGDATPSFSCTYTVHQELESVFATNPILPGAVSADAFVSSLSAAPVLDQGICLWGVLATNSASNTAVAVASFG